MRQGAHKSVGSRKSAKYLANWIANTQTKRLAQQPPSPAIYSILPTTKGGLPNTQYIFSLFAFVPTTPRCIYLLWRLPPVNYNPLEVKFMIVYRNRTICNTDRRSGTVIVSARLFPILSVGCRFCSTTRSQPWLCRAFPRWSGLIIYVYNGRNAIPAHCWKALNIKDLFCSVYGR